MIPHRDDLTEQRSLKTKDPYKEVVLIVTDNYTVLGSFIAWVYTPILGFDAVFCEYETAKDSDTENRPVVAKRMGAWGRNRLGGWG